MASKVRDLETQIRDCINQTRFHYSLYSSSLKNFHVVCSALDVIGDTVMAIEVYEGLPKAGDYGQEYLRLYGFLQALFIQQDAATEILAALNITCAASNELFEVREIRNMAIGHPSRRPGSAKKNIPQSSHAIIRNSINPRGFTLLSYFPDGQTKITHVSTRDLIQKQEAGIGGILTAVLTELQTQEEAHKMQYRDEKLVDIFPATISYYVEKMHAGCSNPQNKAFASMHVDLLSDIIEKFRTALNRRQVLPAYDDISSELDDTVYPLTELKKFFDNDPATFLDNRAARIFVFFVDHQFRHMVDLAKSFDEDYATGAPA